MLNRRQFISFLCLSPFFHGCDSLDKDDTVFINGHIDAKKNHYVSGFNKHGKELFRLALPGKAHGFAINPSHPWQVVATPSLGETQGLVFDARNGRAIRQIESKVGRHFNGHGCFSRDGTEFYNSENIAETGRGMISVRSTLDFSFLREFPAYCIGPHEIGMLPNSTTLVVAGGGILTHPSSGKRELNIPTIASALLYIDSEKGEKLQQFDIDVPSLSFRHLDIMDDGTVLLACQYKGRDKIPPLVAMQKGSAPIDWLPINEDSLWEMNQYTASISVAKNGVVAVSCPRGQRLMFWNVHTKEMIKSLNINDVGGIKTSRDGQYFMASANIGELYLIDSLTFLVKKIHAKWDGCKWTNHMSAITV